MIQYQSHRTKKIASDNHMNNIYKFLIGLTGYLMFEDIIWIIPLITNILGGLFFFYIVKKSVK